MSACAPKPSCSRSWRKEVVRLAGGFEVGVLALRAQSGGDVCEVAAGQRANQHPLSVRQLCGRRGWSRARPNVPWRA